MRATVISAGPGQGGASRGASLEEPPRARLVSSHTEVHLDVRATANETCRCTQTTDGGRCHAPPPRRSRARVIARPRSALGGECSCREPRRAWHDALRKHSGDTRRHAGGPAARDRGSGGTGTRGVESSGLWLRARSCGVRVWARPGCSIREATAEIASGRARGEENSRRRRASER